MARKKRLLGTITVEGKTLADVEEAVQESLRLIMQGYKEGHDENNDGEYYFQVTDKEAP